MVRGVGTALPRLLRFVPESLCPGVAVNLSLGSRLGSLQNRCRVCVGVAVNLSLGTKLGSLQYRCREPELGFEAGFVCNIGAEFGVVVSLPRIFGAGFGAEFGDGYDVGLGVGVRGRFAALYSLAPG